MHKFPYLDILYDLCYQLLYKPGVCLFFGSCRKTSACIQFDLQILIMHNTLFSLAFFLASSIFFSCLSLASFSSLATLLASYLVPEYRTLRMAITHQYSPPPPPIWYTIIHLLLVQPEHTARQPLQ